MNLVLKKQSGSVCSNICNGDFTFLNPVFVTCFTIG